MRRSKQSQHSSDGSILLAMLAFILISFIGISVLGHVVTHQRIIKARMQRISRMEPVYQELLRYLHQFKDRVSQLDIQNTDEPEAHLFNSQQFPGKQVDGISITTHFSHTSIRTGTYQTTTILDRVEASSTTLPYLFVAGVEIDILSGKIPLSLIPLYLKQKIDIPVSSFLKENEIGLNSQSQTIIDDSPQTFDSTAFLTDSLDIQGRMLNLMSVRERLGFEINSNPIPDGIYFIEEGREVETVFVQGNVQKLRLYTLDNRQFVMLEQNKTAYLLSYIPGEYAFTSWDPSVADDTRFDEKIIINGDCLGLEQQGDIAFHRNSDLKLFVSGKTIVKSSLLSEADELTLKKTGWTHLTIISGAHSLSHEAGGKPSLIVENEGETELELSLLINGRIINHSRQLILNGSLFASGIENNGSININHLFSQFNEVAYFSSKNATIIHNLTINYIQEVTNGNK